MPDEKWVSKDYIVAWAASLFIAMNFYLFMVTTSGYAIKSFGVSPAMGGLATSVFVLSAIVTRVIMGRIIFRLGCIRSLTIGLTANLIMCMCYFFAKSLGLLIVVRIFHGFSIGVASTSIFTVGSVLIPKAKSGVGMGYFSLSTTLGTAVGPFLAAALTRSGSYTAVYILTACVALVNISLVPFISLKRACLPDMASIRKPVKGLAGILDTKALPVALICGLAYATYGCIVAFLPESTKGTSLASAAAYFFVFYAAGILASRPLTGRVFDRRGENPMMYTGLAVFAVGMLLTGLAHNGPMLLFAAFLNGAGLGAVMSVTLSIGVKYATPERLGMANATFYIFLDAGLTVGPIAGGLLVPLIGYSGIFTLGMPVAIFGIGLYYLIHGRTHSHTAAMQKQ